MEGYFLIYVLLLTFLLPTECSILSAGEACARTSLHYGGRMSLINVGDGLSFNTGSPPAPWANQRVFIFKMPPSFFKGGHHRPMFGQAATGRIWMSDNSPCGGDRPHESCPSVTPEESFCLDSSLPCYKTPPSYSNDRVEPLEFSDVTPMSITVTWPIWDPMVDDGQGPIVEYVVHMRMLGEDEFTEVPKGMQLSHTFNGLREDTDYEFRVSMFRDQPFGDGRPSNAQTHRTSTRGPPRYANPKPLMFQDVTSYGMSVSWPEWDQRTDHGTGPVTGYTLQYRKLGSTTWTTETSDVLSVRLTDLAEHMNYDMAMRLQYGDHDEFTTSDIQRVDTTCGDVGDITLILSSESIRSGDAKLKAEWSYRDMPNSCSVVNQQISIQQLDKDNCQFNTSTDPFEIDLNPGRRSYTKRRLDEYSEYNVTLTLGTQTRSFHESTKIRTDSSSEPSAPSDLRPEENRRGHSVTFFWNLPACTERHGEIIRFDYEFRRGSNRPPKFDSTTKKRRTFRRLDIGESYSFQVKAVTNIGSGPWAPLDNLEFGNS